MSAKSDLHLYLVRFQGLEDTYVVASDPAVAYKKVRKWLDDNDYGFYKDRCLRDVTLLADAYPYGDAPKRIWL